MNTPPITFIPSADDSNVGELHIPGVCSLEALYSHPNCPDLVKRTLEKHVNWQMRCETPIHRALNLKNHFMAFRAAMAVYGAFDIDEEEEVILKVGKWSTGSSMVRPTPTNTPIVSSFVRIRTKNKKIKKARIAITGIEKRKLTLPETQTLIDQVLTDGLIKDFANQVSAAFNGFDDFNGTADYRKAMVAVTLERALQEVKHG